MRDGGFVEARIFIVDDEPANVRILERLLAQEGYTDLVTMTDPRDVMTRYQESPPDLVLLDLLMPHVDGFEILRRIAEHAGPALRPPVIVLTADVTREARSRALSLGATDFVTKPFDHLEVLLRVRNLLARRALELDLLLRNQVLDERVRARTRELRKNLEVLRRTALQRQFLLDRLVSAQEEERARIAADIHDDTVQAMVAAGIRLELIARRLTDPAQRSEIELLRSTVADALARLRTLMFDLRPPALDRDGLAAALQQYLERSQETGGPAHEVVAHLREEPPPETRVLLFRIAQEALTNVRKHAHARHVRVAVTNEGEGIQLTVEDDGRGFDPERIGLPTPGHLGLTTMIERAAFADGWCRIDTSPGGGTTVTAWIPTGVKARRGRAPRTA